MSLHDDCIELFGHADLYKLFGVTKKDKDSTIKKAYYKLALAYHPDRFVEKKPEKDSSSSEEEEDEDDDEESSEEPPFRRKRKEVKYSYYTDNKTQKEHATRKFQVIGRAYQILSTPDLKEHYDATGSLNENDTGDTDWYNVFKNMFAPVDENAIREYMATYMYSKTEINDIRQAYNKCKGNIGMMYEYVIGLEVETEDRIREVIWNLIDSGQVKVYKAFTDEPPSERQKRVIRAEKERKDAEKEAKKVKQRNKKEDLMDIIQARRTFHQQAFQSIVNKYENIANEQKSKPGRKRKQ